VRVPTRTIGVFSLSDVLANILGLVGYVAVAGFISYWAHRAQAEEGRAAKMGIYLTFGFLWFIVGLIGLSGIVNAWQAGDDIPGSRILLTALGVAAAIALLPWLRKPLAKILPFDGNSYPDMVALMFILQVPIALVGLSLLNDEPETSIQIDTMLINAAAFVSIAYLGVGFLINRDFSNATKRLGLVKPSFRDIAIAIGCVFLALMASIVSSILVQIFQPDLMDDLQDTLTELPGDINIFWAALFIGLTAAVGEEILMRGAIQPRFGIIFTSAVFALLHVQYGLSFAMVGVFFAGIVFGLERKYVNTTACIITHMIYNFIAVMANSALAG
jgi:uncharacterized protein